MWKPATGSGQVQEEFEIFGTDLLIIDSIEVFPRFRRCGLGLAVANRVIDIFGGGCGLVACKPWPLQFTPAFSNNRRRLQKLDAPSTDKETSIQKLRTYWAKAGFGLLAKMEFT